MNTNRAAKKNELERTLRILFRNLKLNQIKQGRMNAYEKEIKQIFKNKNLGKKK